MQHQPCVPETLKLSNISKSVQKLFSGWFLMQINKMCFWLVTLKTSPDCPSPKCFETFCVHCRFTPFKYNRFIFFLIVFVGSMNHQLETSPNSRHDHLIGTLGGSVVARRNLMDLVAKWNSVCHYMSLPWNLETKHEAVLAELGMGFSKPGPKLHQTPLMI